MLTVNIKKDFGAFVLRVAFEAGNEVHAFLGASGCGKSLTLQCIAGIITPDEGKIVLDGVTLFDSSARINLPPQQRRVGLLFQSYALFPNMTVEQNIAAGMLRLPRVKRRSRTAELLRRMYLDGLEKHYPSQISGGQQQRVALARILAAEPQILMLDEPFSALDSYLRWQMEQEVGVVLRHFAGTTLFVSHNRDEVYRLCDSITVVSGGQVSISGEKWALFDNPRTHAAALLTGCKNISRAIKKEEHTVYAVDWGICLRSAHPVPERLAYVGIRAKQIQLSSGREEENVFACAIHSFVEEPFSCIRMLQPAGTHAAQSIRWECNKESTLSESARSAQIHIPSQHVLLLTE